MKKTQGDRILEALKNANGGWINGRYFNNTMMISQYHTRIHELQRKGHKIQASEFTDEYGFKSYRIVENGPITFNKQEKLEELSPKPLFDFEGTKKQPKKHYEYN